MAGVEREVDARAQFFEFDGSEERIVVGAAQDDGVFRGRGRGRFFFLLIASASSSGDVEENSFGREKFDHVFGHAGFECLFVRWWDCSL